LRSAWPITATDEDERLAFSRRAQRARTYLTVRHPGAHLPQRFKSKISAWLIAFLAVIFISIAVPLGLVMRHYSVTAFLLGSSGFIISIVPVVWLLLSTSYSVEGHLLVIRCGPMRYRIPLVDITTVSAISSIESAPALSSDRLVLAYGRGESVMISPKDQAGFLRALAGSGVAAAGSHT
jgi:PH (Pleckstrin Homology) domain-containing protein